VQIASDHLNDLKVLAFGLKPKFHWELSNNSRLFSATALQGRFSSCHFSPPGRDAWIGTQWILTRKGNAVTAVRFLVQETVSSFPVFMRPKPASFAGSFERILL
jgi:hypothetical protein